MSEARSSHDAGPDVSQTAIERLKRLIGDLSAEHPDWALVRRTFEAMPSCLAEWVEAHPDTDWLVPAMESMARSLPQLDPSDSRRYPTRGYYTERPIIAAMAVQPHEGVPPQLVANLQAGILIAAAEREEEVASGVYISPLRSAGQSIRDAARQGLSSSLASDLGSARSIPDLCDRVIDWLTVPEVWRPDMPQLELTSWDTKVLSGLRPLLRDISERRKLRHRAAGSRTVRKTRVESADRTDGPGPAAIGVEYNDSQRRQMRNEALSTSPESSSETYIADHPSSRYPDYSPDRLTEAQANRRNILRARSWKTSQQWTPNRTEILHPPALNVLLTTRPKWDEKAKLRWEML